MTDVVMLEAALFQLRSGAAGVDGFFAPQLDLCLNVLAGAIAAATGGVNAARVNDIEFALNDLVTAIDDAGAPDAVYAAVALLQNDAAALRNATALPKEIVDGIRALQTKLRARTKAMERAQYRVEGTEPEPLPHPPEELREAAIPLARQLAAAGFDTPALDMLIADPDELRYHMMNEIVDELDVIAPSS
jgi:hypothetical protein